MTGDPPTAQNPWQPPLPLLPDHPEWTACYWQAWRGLQPEGPASEALAQVRMLRRTGRLDEAFLTACRFLSQAAEAAPLDKAPTEPSPDRWPALAILLVEEVIGVAWSEEGVRWRLRLEPPAGLLGLETAGAVISLTAEADTGAGIRVLVDASQAFDLTIETAFTAFQERAPAGRTRYLLTYLDRTDIVAAD